MVFRQITHDDLGCASYLDGDGHRRPARCLAVRIEHVLGTHHHADHASGHGGRSPRPAPGPTSSAPREPACPERSA